MRIHSSIAKKVGAIAGVTALMAAALAGCGGSSSSSGTGSGQSSGDPIAGDTLTVGAATAPLSLDPAKGGAGVPLGWYGTLAYEPLIRLAPDGSPTPALATSWASSDGNKTFTMQLRPDVTFSDGEKLTADGVVDWLTYTQKNGVFAGNLAGVTSIAATGPLEVTLELASPEPLVTFYLSQVGGVGFIGSPGALADPETMKSATFGSGPYVLDEKATVPNSSYVYTRNADYWNPSGQHFKKIVVKVIADDTATLAALQSGQIQAAVGAGSSVTAAEKAGLSITSKRGQMTGAVLLDRAGMITPALKDVRVRQALNIAIDKDGVAKSIYGGRGVGTAQYEPEGGVGYVADLEEPYAFDVAKAKQLLADAGYADGFAFKMLLIPGVPGGKLLAQSMVQAWAKIGVDVEITAPAGLAEFVGKASTGEFSVITYQFGYAPLISIVNQLFAPTGLYNLLQVVNPEVEALRAKINVEELGSAVSDDLAVDLQKTIVDQALSVPVASIDTLIFSTPKLGGIEFSEDFPVPDPTQMFMTK